MFLVGDNVVYGSMGVCTVTEIGVPDLPGATRECYVLKPHYIANSKVYAPIEDNPVNIRSLLSAQQAQDLIESMPEICTFPASKDRQALYDTCRSAIKSTDSFMLAKLLKTLHEKKKLTQEQKKTVPSLEKEYFDTAERMLYGEISVSLGIPIGEVQEYINACLEPNAKSVAS